MPDYVLAIDAGTSGVRCLIFDFKGKPVSLGVSEWSYHSPPDIAPFGREFDAGTFWRIICDTIGQAIRNGGVDTREIRSVSATSQREGVVFLDRKGRELYAGPNIDIRALCEGMAIDDDYGKEIYKITGHIPSLMFVPAKLKWFEKNRPQVFNKIATVLSISDWIIYRLCGERVSEICSAAEIGLLDVRRGQWAGGLPALLNLPRGIYPELVRSGSRVGKINRRSAAETGLLEGVIVSAGGPDAQCGLLGMGVLDKGQVGIVSGWSTPVQMVTGRPVFDTKGRTWTGCHLVPDRWILESSASETGNAYRWLKDTLLGDGSSNSEAYDIIDKLSLEIPAGAEGVLAFIGPTAMNMSRVGMKYGGFLFPVPTSAANTGQGHLVRASLENLCYAIRSNCRQLEAVSKRRISKVTIGGGMLRSRCFKQILPDVLGIPVSMAEVKDVSGLGAAICAAAGAGVYSDIEEGARAMASSMQLVEPGSAAAIEYNDYYEAWLSAGRTLDKLSEEIR